MTAAPLTAPLDPTAIKLARLAIQQHADPKHWLACAVRDGELWPGEIDEARDAVRRATK